MTDPLSRRRWLQTALLGLAAANAPMASAAGLKVATSLPDALATALQKGSPLLVMVNLPGCPFCKIATENYLLPLQREQGIVMVQVDMRSRQMVQGFNGASQTHESLSRQWGIKVAPTVLFFGLRGVEVAERLVGGYLADFYGSYLDERVRVARLALPA